MQQGDGGKKGPTRRAGSRGISRREALKSGLVLGGLAIFARARIGGVAGHVEIATGRGRSFIRPPGATDESELVRRCIRCHKCGENCSNACIRFVGPEGPAEARGTPYIVPREKACVLCMRCNNNCPSGALQPVPPDHPHLWEVVDMGVAEIDKNICHSFNGYLCGVCVRACPLEGVALKADLWEKPVLDPEKCLGCGLCEFVCLHMPQAIRIRPRRRAEGAA